MQRSRTQRFFAVIVAIILFAYVFYIGTALFCYEPLVFAMKQADEQWTEVQKTCQQLADSVPGLVKAASADAAFDKSVITELGSAQSTFNQSAVPKLQSPPNSALFAACQKVQDDLIAAFTHFQPAAASSAVFQSSDALKNLPPELEHIRSARQAFNKKAAAYNAKARTFPCIIITNAFGFFQKPYFTSPGK